MFAKSTLGLKHQTCKEKASLGNKEFIYNFVSSKAHSTAMKITTTLILLSGWQCSSSRNFGTVTLFCFHYSSSALCSAIGNFIPLTPDPQLISFCIISWFSFSLTLPTSSENTRGIPWSLLYPFARFITEKRSSKFPLLVKLFLFNTDLCQHFPDFTSHNRILLNETAWLTNFPV